MNTVIVKKYTNNKLYVPRGMTEPVGYITLKDIVSIIRKGKDVRVVDNVTNEDITQATLRMAAMENLDLSVEKLVELIRG